MRKKEKGEKFRLNFDKNLNKMDIYFQSLVLKQSCRQFC